MSDPVSDKTRELLMLQVGSQILALCEANARLDVMTAQLAQVTTERDALKPKTKKAGTE